MRPDAVAAAVVAMAAEADTVGEAAAAVVARTSVAGVDILVVVVDVAAAHGLPAAAAAGISADRPSRMRESRIRVAAGRHHFRARPAATVIAPLTFKTGQAIRPVETTARRISAPTPFTMRSRRVLSPAHCITTAR
jgi:hypothetical protein